MSILKSVLSLAKNNNGFFKSVKQAEFLKSKIEENGGYLGNYNGLSQSPVYAKFDEYGIVLVYSITEKKRNTVIKFERMLPDTHTKEQTKHLKKLNRMLTENNNRLERYLTYVDEDEQIEQIRFNIGSIEHTKSQLENFEFSVLIQPLEVGGTPIKREAVKYAKNNPDELRYIKTLEEELIEVNDAIAYYDERIEYLKNNENKYLKSLLIRNEINMKQYKQRLIELPKKIEVAKANLNIPL